MFTGQVPGKRKINLGGKVQSAAQKQALLEQSRKEREQRELVRRQTEAAVNISRIARGYFVRKRCKHSLIQLLLDEAENPLSVIFLINRIPAIGRISDQVLAEIFDRFQPLLFLNGCGDLQEVVRVSALVRQLLYSPLLAAKASPFVEKLIPLTLSFLPRGMDETMRLFSILSFDSARALMLRIMESEVEQEKVVECSLAFLQEQTSVVTQELSEIIVRFPIITSIPANAGIDVKRICANLVPVVMFMVAKGDSSGVKRLMVSLQSLTGLLNETERENLDSLLMDRFLQEHLSTSSAHSVLLELVRLDRLPEETLYKLATQTKLAEQMGWELVDLFESHPEDGRIHGLVHRFTALYSRVVAGLTSVLSPACVERLFPLLNRYAFACIAHHREVSDSIFELIRAVYAKKHLYPSLRKEEAWVIAEAASLIPTSVYDLTQHTEDMEDIHFGEESSPQGKRQTVFDILIEAMPHVISFNRRLRIFASAIAEDQLRHTRQSWSLRLPWEGGRVKKVRREFLLQDGLEVVSSASREVMRIEFIGRDGSVEAGIDGGGLFKEFMQQWTFSVMNPEFGLFSQLPNGRLTPAVHAYRVHPDADRWFKAAGRAVGKALYEMVLLETHLGEAFLYRVLGRPYSLDQLQELDESLYRNLKFVNDCESVEELELTFSVSTGSDSGEIHELCPNGAELPVTSQNKLRYVLLASWYYLARQLDRPAAAFAAGLSELLPLPRMKLFSPSEINLLVSGEQRKGFQVEDLKANVVYGGGYTEASTTVRLLWEVLTEFSDDDRSAFLAFVTSAPRPPLLGFRVLHPKFGINRVPEPDRLPTSSTCANLLKLPDYQDKKLLRLKLHAAIYSQSGFDLS